MIMVRNGKKSIISMPFLVGLVTNSSLLFIQALNVQYRSGQNSDSLAIVGKQRMIKEFLKNPFTKSKVQMEDFLVAEDNNKDSTTDSSTCTTSSGSPIGWAQLRSLGTKQVDPQPYNARPGSFDLEKDIDDQMWDEFENEKTTAVPSGWSSLPWTSEYKAFSKNAAERRQKRKDVVEKQASKSMIPQECIYELACIHVDPQYRGRGIGTELVQRLLQKHIQKGGSAADIHVVTDFSKAAWYRDKFGFKRVPPEKIPEQLLFQVAKGGFLSSLTGSPEVICLRGPCDAIGTATTQEQQLQCQQEQSFLKEIPDTSERQV